ncbi:MAG: hypothetical protein KGL39_38415 [Patescibacteria group bacterium]|nr:hypothetical protein [Patescibacteria group bacterium]
MLYLSAFWSVLRGLFAPVVKAVSQPISLPVFLWLLPCLAAMWFWHGETRWHDKANTCAIGRKADRAQYDKLVAAANTAKAEAESRYARNAKEAQHAYEIELADARAATERYIATHRLRPAPAPAATPSAPQSDSSAIPADLPTDSVVVPGSDVRACTAVVTYALKAHDWAITNFR